MSTRSVSRRVVPALLIAAISVMLAMASRAVAAPSPTFEKPRLVLQITVDQFRGDLPTRYFDRLGKGRLRFN